MANTSPIHSPSFSSRRACPGLAKSSKQSLFSKCHHTMNSRNLVGTAWASEASGQISHLGELTQTFPCCPEPRARPPGTAEKLRQASCATSLAQLCSLKATARSVVCKVLDGWGWEQGCSQKWFMSHCEGPAAGMLGAEKWFSVSPVST